MLLLTLSLIAVTTVADLADVPVERLTLSSAASLDSQLTCAVFGPSEGEVVAVLRGGELFVFDGPTRRLLIRKDLSDYRQLRLGRSWAPLELTDGATSDFCFHLFDLTTVHTVAVAGEAGRRAALHVPFGEPLDDARREADPDKIVQVRDVVALPKAGLALLSDGTLQQFDPLTGRHLTKRVLGAAGPSLLRTSPDGVVVLWKAGDAAWRLVLTSEHALATAEPRRIGDHLPLLAEISDNWLVLAFAERVTAEYLPTGKTLEYPLETLPQRATLTVVPPLTAGSPPRLLWQASSGELRGVALSDSRRGFRRRVPMDPAPARVAADHVAESLRLATVAAQRVAIVRETGAEVVDAATGGTLGHYALPADAALRGWAVLGAAHAPKLIDMLTVHRNGAALGLSRSNSPHQRPFVTLELLVWPGPDQPPATKSIPLGWEAPLESCRVGRELWLVLPNEVVIITLPCLKHLTPAADC